MHFGIPRATRDDRGGSPFSLPSLSLPYVSCDCVDRSRCAIESTADLQTEGSRERKDSSYLAERAKEREGEGERKTWVGKRLMSSATEFEREVGGVRAAICFLRIPVMRRMMDPTLIITTLAALERL